MGRASEWRQKARDAAVDLELPSGMVILARRPDPLQLAAWGRLPLSLAAAAGEADGAESLSDDQVEETARFCQEVLLYCCVDPKISVNPQSEDEIHPREIPREDWLFLVSWALRVEEARNLEGFRGRRTDAGGGGGGETVFGASV